MVVGVSLVIVVRTIWRFSVVLAKGDARFRIVLLSHMIMSCGTIVSIDKALLGGEFGQCVNQCTTFIERLTFNFDAMSPNIELSPPWAVIQYHGLRKVAINGPHAYEFSLASRMRDYPCGEHGCLGRNSLERRVRMPLLVGATV